MIRPYPLEPLFGRILTPFERFLRRTTAGGIVLIGTTALALLLAAALGADAVRGVVERPLAVSAGGALELRMSLRHWVNDALMALFFVLVGLELKREMLVGELASIRDAALPIVAALGGMAVPAAVYAAFNAGTPALVGWGVPMATDIAFAVGILVLLAWRVPRNLILFLTALAIVDDLGAVLVIALFYTPRIDPQAAAWAAGLLGALVLMNRGGVRHPLPYALAGIALWLAVHASGIHATLAGILLAATIPARPAHSPAAFERRIAELLAAFRADRRDPDTPDDALANQDMASIAEAVERSAATVQSPLHRIEHRLTPWVTFFVIPVFALVNAGIDLTAVAWSEVFASRVTLGIAAGLVLGKFAGIGAFSWLAVRAGIARLPEGVGWRHLLGAAWLAGVGFTMSLFIAQLAFGPGEMEEARLGILLGSLVSALAGLAWLLAAAGRPAAVPPT
ncbi:MAG TPA: Na+/H+ antiporter NhaA [Burkholderiales bacterium]|nr:Na+/H+ antiporter NhaA [Burkholderiales bacterium]